MRARHKFSFFISTAITLGLILPMSSLVQAHLMVAQHGTLNIVGDDVFMVLSLPISAFEGVDDDKDGKVSMVDFNHHRAAIADSIRQNVTLGDAQKAVALEEVVLSPVVPHGATDESVSQLAVMGRFTLKDSATALWFSVGLYGRRAAERALEMTATRKHDNQKAVFELTPAASAAVFFAVNS